MVNIKKSTQNILILTFIKQLHIARHLLLILACCGVALAKDSAPPSVMLAKTYTGQNVSQWLASEKLDGVRGFWDGEKFYSRNGKLLTTPAGFTENFPPFPLDGELFGGRGTFAQTAGRIRQGEDWTGITFQVFDVPTATGGLMQRLALLQDWLTKHPTKNINIIEQTPIVDINAAQEMLKMIEKKGGEGLILREPNAPYSTGRSPTILKLKTTDDAECTVTAHHQGKGKYQEMLGSLSCLLDNGKVIRIGSGFTDIERENPPPLGSVITFRYRGFTKNGLPRFATFWRERTDADLSQ